jgi:S-adenosylmethionine synthetase
MSTKITAEYIGLGHPDKMADQISDAIVGYIVKQDRNAHCAIETLIKNSTVIIAGEVTTNVVINIDNLKEIVKEVIEDIGYDDSINAISFKSFDLITMLDKQSSDINEAVKDGDENQGAGDQGIVVGAATNETKELMPLAYMLAYGLIKKYEEKLPHRSNEFDWARPDCKSQVTLEYSASGKLIGVSTIVMSVQHDSEININSLRGYIMESVIKPVLKKYNLLRYLCTDTIFLINPSGKFVTGGPKGDCGLTGRKIIADTYGSIFRHGGGAFSGKDLTKTDRSGAYYARLIAKEIVASGLAEQAEVEITFAIGYSKPVSCRILTKNLNLLKASELELLKEKVLNTSIKELVETVKNKNYNYLELARTGVVNI